MIHRVRSGPFDPEGNLTRKEERRAPGHAEGGRADGRGLLLGLFRPQRAGPRKQLRRGVHRVIDGRPSISGHGHERGHLDKVPGFTKARRQPRRSGANMAAVATKEVMAYRMQARELGHGNTRPYAPVPGRDGGAARHRDRADIDGDVVSRGEA